MLNSLTELILIVDRSGSMSTRQKDAEGGIKEFIRSQKEQPGECSFTLVEFDDQYNFVHKGKNIQEIKNDYKLVPRGSTALLDAVGNTLVQIGKRLSDMQECDRPGLVMVVIVTDGEENSSKEFTKNQIQEMIKHQQDVYSWQFTFLGASDSAFTEAGSMGIVNGVAGAQGVCGSVGATGAHGTTGGYKAAASLVNRMRKAKSIDQNIDNAYTEEEFALMN